MAYKIHRIKLTLLYTASVISFFMVLLAVVGVVPAIPWYGSLSCLHSNIKSYDAEGEWTLDEDTRTCKILSIGLLVSSICEGGKCETKSNSKLEFGNVGAGFASLFDQTRNTSTSESIGGVSYTTDLSEMSDVEKAGGVAFPFLLLGFITVSLLGLLSFHHVVSETFHHKITLAFFGTTFVFLLLSWSIYIGIMESSDTMDEFCDTEFKFTANENITTSCPLYVEANKCDSTKEESTWKSCFDCDTDDESLCGPALGFWLTVLASFNMLLGGGLSYFTATPDVGDEE